MSEENGSTDRIDRNRDRIEAILDETEYDTELGIEMAEDAIAVVDGDLSEREFHERYHDDVIEEFGVDDRPTREAFEAEGEDRGPGVTGRVLERFEDDGEQGRRETMKKMGLGAAAIGLGAWGTTADTQPDTTKSVAAAEEDEEQNGIRWGKVIDLERCDGCLSCVVACAEENQTDQGINWMYVLDYEDGDAETSRNRVVRSCQHCTDAPCEKVCPTTARHTRDSDGLVLTDYDVCIGCRYCQVACPYGLNYFQWDEPETSHDELAAMHSGQEGDHMHDDRGRWVASRAPIGVMSKCTFNVHRQDGHKGEEKVGTTACQEACPPGAIQFGNRNDSHSDPEKYLDNPSKSRTLHLLSIPSPDTVAEQLEGADADLDAVLEAAEGVDEELLTLLKAVEIVSDGVTEPDVGNSSIAELERQVHDVLAVIEDHGLDIESETVLVELGLADEPGEDEEFDGPSESDAQARLRAFAGDPESNFKLLESAGTDPVTTFLGNEPGPNAEQVEGPVAYENVDQTDRRKDVTDESTVDGGLFS